MAATIRCGTGSNRPVAAALPAATGRAVAAGGGGVAMGPAGDSVALSAVAQLGLGITTVDAVRDLLREPKWLWFFSFHIYILFIFTFYLILTFFWKKLFYKIEVSTIFLDKLKK